jgi:pimeloyl-ACP methyl ester carboxylesterase
MINLKIIASVILLLLTTSAGIAAEMDDHHLTTPGRLIDIGGYKLHILCEGQGEPVVIFDAGIGGFSLEWIPVQRMLENEVMACAYDRAGYGWSDQGPSPRTTDQIVEELHSLLQKASIPPPYVLVGHSFGGYNMQYFAKVYPGESAGLVLVDSSHPEQVERLPDLPARRENSRSSEIITFFQGQSTFQYYPEDVIPTLFRMLTLSKTYTTLRRESVNFAMSGGQVLSVGQLPDIPLIVITRGRQAWPDNPYGNMLETVWLEMQKELSALTPHGKQIMAEHSTHLIHLEQPELVSGEILSVVNEIRRSDAVNNIKEPGPGNH